MKYCAKCRKIYNQDIDYCSECKGLLKSEVHPEDPVFLTGAYGFDRDRIKAALQDANIPFAEKMVKKEISAELVTGDKHYRTNLYVPYEMLEKAKEVLVGIGAMQPEDRAAPAQVDLQGAQTEYEEMKSWKRFLWRAISVVLFIAVVWAVVSGTDWLMEIVKRWF